MLNQFQLLDKFVWYLTERWSMHQKRLKGLPPPWTDDAVLQKYRFCQVRREDDRVTRWIHENWLRPHSSDRNLWHAMCVARMFNHIDTLDEMGWPEPWGSRRDAAIKLVAAKKSRGEKMFSSAYTLVSLAYYIVGSGKQQSLLDHHIAVFDDAWHRRTELHPQSGDTLHDAYARLRTLYGFGSFLAGQVIADVKYGDTLSAAVDWDTFAVSGSGSLRGLNRVCGRPLMQRWNEVEWHATLLDLRKTVLPKLPRQLRSLDASNIEHGLCEFDKYQRVSEGGKLSRLYKAPEPGYMKGGK